MRTLLLLALLSILPSLDFASPTNRKTASPTDRKIEQNHLTQNSNYVVIGAFAIRDNAMRQVSRAKGYNFHAYCEMNQSRNLYYVYVLQTNDMGLAIAVAMGLREETRFNDAWVFNGSFTENGDGGRDINPATTQPIAINASDNAMVTSTDVAATTAQQPVATVATTTEPAEEPAISHAADSKAFIFQLVRGSDNKIVEGEVGVIDTDRSRKMASYKANTTVYVSPPNSKTEKITVSPEVFGYRKSQIDLDFNTPQGEAVTTDEKNNIVVPFELVRLRKGDIAVMYNVFFYKDAAVMRPESKYEMNSLLEMMKENEKCKIKIHGHTNGGAPGKIISVAKGSTNHFSLNDTKEGFGSAKQLSGARAELIRQYLISNGIKEDRMLIKAWGGKRPIHDKNSNHAGENVRVEVEILAD